jgi:hypothetical protein
MLLAERILAESDEGRKQALIGDPSRTVQLDRILEGRFPTTSPHLLSAPYLVLSSIQSIRSEIVSSIEAKE